MATTSTPRARKQEAQYPVPAPTSTINQTLCGKFKGHFVTAAYVFIDTEKKMLRYAGAGHPPMLLRSHANGVRELVENGLFLGSFPFAEYSAIELPFDQGDWVMLYTDGVLEMNNANEEEFGIDRLKLFLEMNENRPAAKFLDATLAELSRWSAGREAEDDLTLLAIHFNPA